MADGEDRVPNAIDEATRDTIEYYTACDVAEALVRLGVPGGGVIKDLKLFARPESDEDSTARRIRFDRVLTMLFVDKDAPLDPSLPEPNIPQGKHWADLCVWSDIALISQPDSHSCAVLGGVTASRLKANSCPAIIVNGRVRDMAQLSDTNLHIWAKGTSTAGANLEAKPHAVKCPIKIGKTIVNNGDALFCDSVDGVVAIPRHLLDKVVGMLPGILNEDRNIIDAVQDGMDVQEAYEKWRY